MIMILNYEYYVTNLVNWIRIVQQTFCHLEAVHDGLASSLDFVPQVKKFGPNCSFWLT